MADDATPQTAAMRPNDLFSAAYYGDVKKLEELLKVDEVEDDPPLEEEFDPLAAPDEEAEEAANDRAKRRQLNEETIAARLRSTGCIVTRLSPVNVRHYGIGMLVGEDNGRCRVQFKPSARSTTGATALHWAALGREHAAVEYLLLMGADPAMPVPGLGVSLEDLLSKNQSLETRKAVDRGIAACSEIVARRRAAADARETEVKRRLRLRQAALDDQARKEEEERRAAEEETDAAGMKPDDADDEQ